MPFDAPSSESSDAAHAPHEEFPHDNFADDFDDDFDDAWGDDQAAGALLSALLGGMGGMDRSETVRTGAALSVDVARAWIEEHRTAALLGSFAVGVFTGAMLRD